MGCGASRQVRFNDAVLHCGAHEEAAAGPEKAVEGGVPTFGAHGMPLLLRQTTRNRLCDRASTYSGSSACTSKYTRFGDSVATESAAAATPRGVLVIPALPAAATGDDDDGVDAVPPVQPLTAELLRQHEETTQLQKSVMQRFARQPMLGRAVPPLSIPASRRDSESTRYGATSENTSFVTGPTTPTSSVEGSQVAKSPNSCAAAITTTRVPSQPPARDGVVGAGRRGLLRPRKHSGACGSPPGAVSPPPAQPWATVGEWLSHLVPPRRVIFHSSGSLTDQDLQEMIPPTPPPQPRAAAVVPVPTYVFHVVQHA